MFSYFENRKTTYFDVFCLNFSIQTKIKTLFVISYFNLSKKRNGTLGTRIELLQASFQGIITTLSYNFGRLYCYEVTLVKKCNEPLLHKSETKIFHQKIYKKLVQCQ